MDNKIELEARPRTVLGKEVKKLRRQNLTPVNVYGHGIDSVPLQVESRALARAMAQAGKSTLLTLAIEGQKPRTVVVRGVQMDPRTQGFLHVDFYQVRLTQKMKVQIPLRFVGDLPVNLRSGTVVHSTSQVEIECLPKNMPQSLDVDVSAITEFNTPLHVKDISVPKGVTMLTDPDAPVAVAEPPRVAEEFPTAAAPAPAEEKGTEQAGS